MLAFLVFNFFFLSKCILIFSPGLKVSIYRFIFATFYLKEHLTRSQSFFQFCNLKFGSWTHNGYNLDIVPEEASADTAKYIKHGEWTMVSMTAKRNETFYKCCPEPYPDITYTLHLRRKPMFYFVNVIAPCFMISGKEANFCSHVCLIRATYSS